MKINVERPTCEMSFVLFLLTRAGAGEGARWTSSVPGHDDDDDDDDTTTSRDCDLQFANAPWTIYNIYIIYSIYSISLCI